MRVSNEVALVRIVIERRTLIAVNYGLSMIHCRRKFLSIDVISTLFGLKFIFGHRQTALCRSKLGRKSTVLTEKCLAFS